MANRTVSTVGADLIAFEFGVFLRSRSYNREAAVVHFVSQLISTLCMTPEQFTEHTYHIRIGMVVIIP